MAKILAPNKGYHGITASVQFTQGVGATDDPHLLDWFRQHGYAVLEEAPATPEAPAVDPAENPVAEQDKTEEPPAPAAPAVDPGENPVAKTENPGTPATEAKRGGK